jgi:hypothetical protein
MTVVSGHHTANDKLSSRAASDYTTLIIENAQTGRWRPSRGLLQRHVRQAPIQDDSASLTKGSNCHHFFLLCAGSDRSLHLQATPRI